MFGPISALKEKQNKNKKSRVRHYLNNYKQIKLGKVLGRLIKSQPNRR